MTESLSGTERLVIVEKRLGDCTTLDFLDGSQGFIAEQTFEEADDYYEITTFRMFTPRDQFAFRIRKATGEITIVYTRMEGEDIHVIANERSKKSERLDAERMADGVLLELNRPTVRAVGSAAGLEL